MNEDQEINARLFHIQRQMNDQLSNMNSLSQGLTQITQNLSQTHKKGDELDGHVMQSKKKITLIEKYEEHQNLIFRLSFFLLLATLAYFVLKRFWLHQIIAFVVSTFRALVSKISGLLISSESETTTADI